MTGNGPSDADATMSNVMFLDTIATANTVLEYTENDPSSTGPHFNVHMGNPDYSSLDQYVGRNILNKKVVDITAELTEWVPSAGAGSQSQFQATSYYMDGYSNGNAGGTNSGLTGSPMFEAIFESSTSTQ